MGACGGSGEAVPTQSQNAGPSGCELAAASLCLCTVTPLSESSSPTQEEAPLHRKRVIDLSVSHPRQERLRCDR